MTTRSIKIEKPAAYRIPTCVQILGVFLYQFLINGLRWCCKKRASDLWLWIQIAVEILSLCTKWWVQTRDTWCTSCADLGWPYSFCIAMFRKKVSWENDDETWIIPATCSQILMCQCGEIGRMHLISKTRKHQIPIENLDYKKRKTLTPKCLTNAPHITQKSPILLFLVPERMYALLKPLPSWN